MQLKIKNRVITDPIINILYQARREANNGKLKDIIDKHNGNLLVTCPIHKDGFERRPSCTVSTATDTDLEPGFAHCFTCGYSAPLTQFIADVFNVDDVNFGVDWLKERYGTTLVSSVEYLPEITLERQLKEKNYLDESTLLQYDYYHPYMWYRKLTQEVVDMFRVGYDKTRDAITFPVYDEKHKLVMVTARSVNTKMFFIPAEVEKPVYLLYHILENNIKTVYVCESQINALYMWSLGYPTIALFGTGSEQQYETLRKSGIRNFILCFDGDEAGQKGAYRFRKNMPKDCFITEVKLPTGKDVNDLSAEEIKTLLSYS